MKDKLLYSAVGGCFGAVLTTMLTLFSPLNAQDNPFILPDVSYNTITCSRLNVVDAQDNTTVAIGTNAEGGYIEVRNPDESQSVNILAHDKYGGRIALYGRDEDFGWTKNEKGMFVPIHFPRLHLGVNEHGGYVKVRGGGSYAKAIMKVNESGNGNVSVWQSRWFSSKGEWKDAFENVR